MNMCRHGPENGLRKLWAFRPETNLLRLYMKCFSALCSFLFWYIF